MTTPISETVCHLLGIAMFNHIQNLQFLQLPAKKIRKAMKNVEIVVVWGG